MKGNQRMPKAMIGCMINMIE